MIDNTELRDADPFEAAAAAARAEVLEPDIPEPSANGDLANDSADDVPVVRRRRGRPRSSRPRSRSRRPARTAAGETTASESAARSHSTATVTQTEAAPQVVVAPIDPKTLVPLLKQIDKTFVRLLRTAPLDDEELKNGADACAPVLDHYAPLFLSQPWAPAALWAAMVYAPRVVEVYDRRKQQGGGPVAETFPPVAAANTPASTDPTATRQAVVGH